MTTLPDIPGVADLQLIGRGGAADVYSGVRRNLLHDEPEQVAVKVFRATVQDERTQAQFRSECAIYRDPRLAELAVVQVPEANLTWDGRPYLVMELCTGSLARRVAEHGPVPASDVAGIGAGLAAALHGLRLPHGDVTPSNILFRQSGTAVLSDFGLSVRGTDGVRQPNLLTPEYAAPELWENAPRTGASDIFGLGASLYYALTGAPPIPWLPGESQDSYRRRVLMTHSVAPIRRSDVPSALADMIAGMLASDERRRPQAAAVVVGLAGFGASRQSGPTAQPSTPTRLDTQQAPDSSTERPMAVPTPPDDWHREHTADPGQHHTQLAPDQVPATKTTSRSGSRRPLVIGLASLAVLVVGLGFVLFAPSGTPPRAGSEQPETAGTTTEAAEVIVLNGVRDNGATVSLRWTGPAGLSYAVLVIPDVGATETIPVRQRKSYVAQVSSAAQYCFAVQATDGTQVVQSAPVPIRNAKCHL